MNPEASQRQNPHLAEALLRLGPGVWFLAHPQEDGGFSTQWLHDATGDLDVWRVPPDLTPLEIFSDAQTILQIFRTAMQEQTVWDWKGRTTDDLGGKPFRLRIGPYKSGLLGVLLDNSAEVEARDTFEELMATVPGIIYRCALDEDWSLYFISEGIRDLAGYGPEDFVQHKTVTFGSLIHPEDSEMVFQSVMDATKQKRPYSLSYRIIHQNGDIRWVSEKGRGVFSPSGELRWLDGAIVDITEIKRLEEAFHQAQKLESLGILAGGLAHDFNNLLVSILGFSELAKKTLSDPAKAAGHLESSVRASKQAAGLCQQMLAFAGRGASSPKAVSLNDQIIRNTHLFKAALGPNITLHLELGGDMPQVKADPSQMDQILMNLLLNASQAMQNQRGGNIWIRTRSKWMTAQDLQANRTGESLDEGEYVLLEVVDDGPGMEQQVSQRIFDPFFTTKSTGKGLGLASVLGILRLHKAGMFLRTEPGKGADFTVVLPPLPRSQDRERFQSRGAGWKGSGAVLVIDDEAPVREVAMSMLQEAGFTGIPVESGQSGLDQLHKKPEAHRAVILDMNLPGMHGLEVLRKIRIHHPELAVVLTSGFHRGHEIDQLELGRFTQFLPKPFTPNDLVEALKKMLDPDWRPFGQGS